MVQWEVLHSSGWRWFLEEWDVGHGIYQNDLSLCSQQPSSVNAIYHQLVIQARGWQDHTCWHPLCVLLSAWMQVMLSSTVLSTEEWHGIITEKWHLHSFHVLWGSMVPWRNGRFWKQSLNVCPTTLHLVALDKLRDLKLHYLICSWYQPIRVFTELYKATLWKPQHSA